MAVTISGTSGITGVDGTAAAPSVTGTDTNTGLTFPAADTVSVATGGTERMRIDSSGNVGIGTTSPNGYGAGFITVQANGSTGGLIQASYGTTTAIAEILTTSSEGRFGTRTNHPMLLKTNNVEVGRFDTSGNFYFNSGYGSVSIAYGCRAWVNFAGASGTIAASGNVSSVTRNTTGDYTVNFTSALVDANYAATAMCTQFSGAETSAMEIKTGTTPTTSSFTMRASYNSSGAGYFDPAQVHVMVVR